MICCALLAAVALLGLGEARSAGDPSPKYHVPLTTKMISYRRNHNRSEPVRQRSVYLVGKIGVGTPRQELDILFDLASFDMIVPSTNSTTNKCDAYPCFNGNASSTFKNTGIFWEDDYGAGSDLGIIATDTVQVGDLVVSGQAFSNCFWMDLSETDTAFAFHGIIGLNFRVTPGLIEKISPPLLSNAKAEGAIKKQQFAILYSRGSKDGKLTIGGWDESLASEDQITWIDHPMVIAESFKFWGFSAVDVSAESGEKTKSIGSITRLILDTGNPTFLDVPYDLFYAFKTLFSQYGQVRNLVDLFGHVVGFTLQEKIEKLPPLTFEIQGHKFTLKPSQYVFFHEDDPGVTPGFGKVEIYLSELSMAGGIFLRNFYTIYDDDVENFRRMGLVPVSEIRG